jgi:F0F1-type ATP synthase delta subunit
MDRTFKKAENHKEAEKWDIKQQINLTPRQRQKIAKELKKRFYGKNPPDVRSKRT